MMGSAEPSRVGDTIYAPRRAESQDGNVIGIAYLPLNPGDPDYDMWDRYMKARADAPDFEALLAAWNPQRHPRDKSSGAPLTAAADVMDGAMVALVPSQHDIERLTVEGGEPAQQLHLTIAYLGKADQISAPLRQTLIQDVSFWARGDRPQAPIKANGFAAAMFNPDTADSAMVIQVSDGNDGDTPLTRAHSRLLAIIATYMPQVFEAQHWPWIPHVTLAYSDDPSMFEKVKQRTGFITFDRVRLAFAGHVTDAPLSGTLNDQKDGGSR